MGRGAEQAAVSPLRMSLGIASVAQTSLIAYEGQADDVSDFFGRRAWRRKGVEAGCCCGACLFAF